MSTPLISVITAHAGNPLLKRCVESVRDQTYTNIQHLVVSDGPATWGHAAQCWMQSGTTTSA
jgi:glycosyltransferase involved in cell wall biosynthesis